MISLLVGKIRSSLGSWDENGTFPVRGGKPFEGIKGFPPLALNGIKRKEMACSRLAAGIPALVEALRTTISKAEGDFLRLGDELQTVYSKATELARQIVEAISTIDSADGTGILQELRELVKESLTNLAACREEAVRKEEIIRLIAADMSGLDRHCSEAERMATYLTVIGFNIRIESSQKEEFDKLFGVIAGEIKQSSARITEIIDRIRNDAEILCRDQGRASAVIVADLAELGGLSEEADRLVSKAFGQIEELIGLACIELKKAEEHSTTLAGKVGEIVMSIQLHDSMNQRIEHVIEALLDVEKMILAGTVEKTADMLDVVNLQQAQLQNLVAEVEEVYVRTRNAFKGIGSCVEALTGSLAGFETESDNSVDDPFGRLTEAFMQLDQLLGRGVGLIAGIDESAENTAVASGKLSQYLKQIQDISFQTRLVGLNSIVNAARLGEQGQIFEVLSNQLTVMTQYSEGFVGSVEKIVSAIKGHIEKAQGQQSDDRMGDKKHELSIGEVIEHSSKRYARFHEKSVASGSVAEAVNDHLARIRVELDSLDRLRKELAGLSDRCGELAALLDPWAATGQKSCEQYRQELAERYTMQQERDIHDNVLSLPGAVVRTEEGEQEDDVKLIFDENPQSEKASAASVESLAGKDEDVGFEDNVELF